MIEQEYQKYEQKQKKHSAYVVAEIEAFRLHKFHEMYKINQNMEP